ncbi:hypothetical protein [Methylobacterium sp. NEAU K]|uniref:hypothetical protein n=1 Tax=Methylobacterium sp. NEAU K TaxID=3064946 RepID=UPI0027329F45|nr:hypothetical protein [Methylobacterium sp. NEAU K]MDP4005113.1 hypothetical protein [Methylobacterium sp. NEAU K]
MNAFREAHRHVLPGAKTIASAQVPDVIASHAEREADLAVVTDHHGINAFTDELLMARVFRRFGLEMLTEDALAMLAREYEANAALRERMDAENRALTKLAGAR